MLFPTSLLVLLTLSGAQLATALPTRANRERAINLSAISKADGSAVTHSIDTSKLDPVLAKAIEGSDLNINILGDKRRSTIAARAGVFNSTINLTVIGANNQGEDEDDEDVAERLARRAPAVNATETPANLTAPANVTTPASNSTSPSSLHHNVNIDASTAGNGTTGGINNSTININLNQNARRKVATTGAGSVHLDSSTLGDDTTGEGAGIEESVVHINILPGRALDKSVGDHSIVIDSSVGNDDGSTATGDHSALVDTSSSTNATDGAPSGIKSSTINLTVVAPKKENASAPLVRRSERPAWASNINRKSFGAENATEEKRDFVEAPLLEASGRRQVRRSHLSRPRTLVVLQ